MKLAIAVLYFFVVSGFSDLGAQEFPTYTTNQNAELQRDEEIHAIALNGTPEELKQVLKSGYDVNQVNHCVTLLNLAIQSLVVNDSGPNLNSPKDAVEKVKLLVNSGADVNQEPCSTNTLFPLGWAISLTTQSEIQEKNLIEAVDNKVLRGQGDCNISGVISKPCKDITSEDRQKMREVYHKVFKSLRKMQEPQIMEMVEFLVDSGANVNQQNFEGLSSLHLAANISKGESLELLKYLLKKGANVNARDIRGNTPLFAAAAANNDEAIRLLIEGGADINIRNKMGQLYTEVQRGTKFNVIQK